MKIPDNIPDKYDRITSNYKQVKTKINQLERSALLLTDNEKIILAILKDIQQMIKTMNGIQKDDDI